MSYAIPLDFKGNRHPAKLAANGIIEDLNKTRNMIVVKDTGAGGTTGICSALMDKKETFLLVEPLRMGAREVLQECVKFIDELHNVTDPEKIIEIKRKNGLRTFPTNKDCAKVKKFIEENPEAKEWDVFFINCKECEQRDHCEVYSSVLPDETGNVRGHGTTYSSIIASMKSMYRDMMNGAKEHSLGHMRIDKIMREVSTVVFDESHILSFHDSVSVPVYNVTDDLVTSYRNVFSGIMCTQEGEYTELKEILGNVDKLISDPLTQAAIKRCVDESKKDDNSARLLNVRIRNWHQLDTEEPNAFKKLAALNQEMIDLYTDNRRPVARLSDIKNVLQPIVKLITNRHMDLQTDWTGGKCYVNLIAYNKPDREALDDFIEDVIKAGKKVIFLTATKGPYNYDKYLKNGGHIKTVMMGKGGDPCDQAGDQLIFPDTSKLAGDRRNAFGSRYPYIRSTVLDILRQEGKRRVVLVCRKRSEAESIRKMVEDELGWFFDTEHRQAENDYIITYYRGPDSHSGRFYFYIMDPSNPAKVRYIRSNPAQVMVLIGCADTPGHCMDIYCKTAEESRIMRLIEMHMQMFQMIGRIKGNGRSMVYCVAIDQDTVQNMIQWGTQYKMEIDNNPTHPKISIDVGKALNKPSVLECKTWKERLERGRLYLNGFLGVIRFADLGEKWKGQPVVSKSEFLSQNWDSILENQIKMRSGFSPQFWVPPFRQLPKLPASVKSVQLLTDQMREEKFPDSLIIYLRECGEKTREDNLILLETNTDIQILQVGKFRLRTPADISNFSGSLLCGSIETVAEVLDHYRGPYLREIERSEAEKRFRAICEQVRVAPKPVNVVDGLTLLREVFCGCDTRYAVRTKTSKGWDYFTARDRQGNDKKIDDYLLLGHMAGNHTILTYTTDDFDMVRHITFDIDAHEEDGVDTHETYIAKLMAARTKRAVIMGLLESLGMHPMYIKSGSLGSHHIVLPVLPVSAAKAHYFANCVMAAAGYPESRKHERFPKQPTCQVFYGRDEVPFDELEMARISLNLRKDLLGPTVGETQLENYMKYGNGTKIPFCADRKNGKYVYMYHPEEKKYCRYMVRAIGNGFDPVMYWVDEDGNPLERQYMPVWAVDLSGIEVPEEAKPVPERIVTSEAITTPMEMRSFFKWLLKQGNLIHSAGHYLRVALFYELAYRCKMDDRQILEVFRSMGLSDFSEQKTMENIRSTRAVGHSRPYSMEKVRALISPANWDNYQAGRAYIPDDFRSG